jgi:hypothetical protein
LGYPRGPTVASRWPLRINNVKDVPPSDRNAAESGRRRGRLRRREGAARLVSARRAAGDRRDALHARRPGWPSGAQLGQQVPALAAGGRRPLGASSRLLPPPPGRRRGCSARCWSSCATRTRPPFPGQPFGRRTALLAVSYSGSPEGTTSRSWAGTNRLSKPSFPSCAHTWLILSRRTVLRPRALICRTEGG